MVEADVESRLTALEEGQEWLTHKIHRTDDRMDRVWAQTRTFVINSDALEAVWTAHPDPVQAVSQGDAGNKFLKELAEALDFPYPLTDDLPPGMNKDMDAVRAIYVTVYMLYRMNLGCAVWLSWKQSMGERIGLIGRQSVSPWYGVSALEPIGLNVISRLFLMQRWQRLIGPREEVKFSAGVTKHEEKNAAGPRPDRNEKEEREEELRRVKGKRDVAKVRWQVMVEDGEKGKPLVVVKVRDAEAAKAVVSKRAMAPPGVDACPGGLENMGIKVVGTLVVRSLAGQLGNGLK